VKLTETLFLPTLPANTCPDTLARALMEVAGMRQARVDVAARRVTVTYEEPATPASIQAALVALGYPPASAP
jgi:copper chaperone CopZ